MRRIPSSRQRRVSTAPLDRPEIRIRPKPRLDGCGSASRPTSIAEAVRVATIGDVGANLPKFNAGDRQMPIRVQLPETARGDRADFETLKVPAKTAAAVPLTSVADIDFGAGPASIERYDRGACASPSRPI